VRGGVGHAAAGGAHVALPRSQSYFRGVFSTRTGGRTAPRHVALAILLLLIVLLAGVLVVDAWQARRTRTETAERALGEYAVFASWQFAERASRALGTLVTSAFDAHSSGEMPPGGPEGTDRANRADGARRADRPREVPWCRCLDSVRAVLHFRVADGVLTVSPTDGDGAAPPLSPSALRWIEGAMRTRAAARKALLATVRAQDTTGFSIGPPASPSSPSEMAWYFPRLDGRNVAVVFALHEDPTGEPTHALGFVSEAGPFIVPFMRAVLVGAPLLPAAVTRGLPTDSVIVVTLRDSAGRVAYSSVPARASRHGLSDYASSDSLSRAAGALRFSVALREDALSRLVVPTPSVVRLVVTCALLLVVVAATVVLVGRVRQAAELTRARAAFVSGVSHELRTPLTQIRLFADLLQDRALRHEDDRVKWARVIDREARRLAYLVDNVLSFARVEQGTLVVRPVPTDVAAVIDETLQGFQPIAEARGSRISVQVPASLWATVDAGALRHILLNFLDNAVKYGRDGQTIVIHAATVGEHVRLAVEDEGRGVPEALRRAVWEPYRRLDTDPAVGGSGIGLAIVQELVRLHGARAWVESAPTGGARFVVAFAAAAAEERPRRDAATDAAARH